MKASLSPINIAVDAVALFVGMIAWVYIVWAPLFCAVVLLCLVKQPVSGLLVVLSAIATVLILLGILLKWLSNGLAMRKPIRTCLSILVLAFLSLKLGFIPLVMGSHPAPPPIDQCMIGIAFLLAASIAALGLTKNARQSNGQ
jgi:hypothetical protein